MMDEHRLRKIEMDAWCGNEPLSEHWSGVVGELVAEVRRQRDCFSIFDISEIYPSFRVAHRISGYDDRNTVNEEEPTP